MSLETVEPNYKKVLMNGGGRCPCCRRWGKVNRKGFSYGMLMTLKVLALAPGWVNTTTLLDHHDSEAVIKVLRNRSWPHLEYWGLAEPKLREDGTAERGMWRATAKGRQFLRGKIDIPEHLFVYDNVVVEEDTTRIYVHQVRVRPQEHFRMPKLKVVDLAS